MEGRCPGCNRAYDISEEFLSMGGKAKCPHCLLELEFDESGSSSGADRFHDVTRADDRQHRLSYEEQSDEVDSHCPSCERCFKVDRKYLELGGDAQCPHCGVQLEFDTGAAPAEEPQDIGAPAEGADVWGKSGEISLPELDELRVPTSVEEPPQHEEEHQDEAEDDSLAFDDEVEDEVSGDSVEEPEPDEGLSDEDLADEMPTQMMEGRPSIELAEGLEDQANGEEPAEPSEPGEPSVDLAEELFGQEAGEEQVEEEQAAEGAAGLSGAEGGGPLVLGEEPSGPDGPFGALASNEDWASAAARWAESGFKADEMPSFIKTEDEPGPAEEVGGLHQEPAPPGGELLLSEAAEAAVEVSDADILMLEQSEADILPESASTGAGPSWAESASRDVEVQRAKKPPMAKAERLAKEPSFFDKFKSPWVIAGMLGGVVVLAGALLWIFLGGGEDVGAYKFPKEGVKASIVKAPAPSIYKAKEDAVEHYGLGNRLAYQGKFEDAILEYKQALKYDPGYPHPHRALGAVYAALGKPKLSALSYETYLRLSPHSADARQVRQIVKASAEK